MIRKQDAVKEVLISIGLLDEAKIQKALEEQAKTGQRLSSVLVKLGYVSNQEVGKTLIPQIGILPVAMKPENTDDKLKDRLPVNLGPSHRLIPLREENNNLVLGTDDPLNFLAQKNLEKMTGASVEFELVQTKDLDKALKALGPISKQKSDIDFAKASENIKAVKGSTEDAPIIKLVNLIIQEAVKQRASDVHIEPFEHKFRVRYRIDGVLHEVPGPPKRLQGSIISRLKIMAGMDIAEKRLPQDGRIKIGIDKKELDLRVSSLPGIHGESVVMRILDKSSFLVGLEDMGFMPDLR